MTYRIHSTKATYELTTASGIVTNSSRALDWAIGVDFPHVRNWCEAHGFIVEPVVEAYKQLGFDYGPSRYEITIQGGNVTRVTKDDKDITWQQLPETLKGMI